MRDPGWILIKAVLLLACSRTSLLEDVAHDATIDADANQDTNQDAQDDARATCTAPTPRVLAEFPAPSWGNAGVSSRIGVQMTAYGDYVYFTFDATVARVSKCGGAIEVLAKDRFLRGVTSDGTTTYFIRGEPPQVAAVAIGQPKPVTLATFAQAGGPYFDIILDGNTLFFPVMSPGQNTIDFIPTTGGTPSVLGPGRSAMAVHPGTVFTSSPGHIIAIDRTTLAVRELAPVTAERMAVDATDVYFITTQSGTQSGYVARVPQEGGAIHQLATNLGWWMGGIAVDSKKVYFVCGEGGATHLYSTPKEGGQLEVLGESERMSPVAIDETSIFWATRSAVMRLDK